jgi:SAM-dependent methyltransferase
MNIKKEVTQMDREALKEHWEQVYSTRPTEKLGWYEPHLLTSFSWITGLSVAIDASIIDVGGGASTLADDLLNAGYRSITLLDISEKALSSIKARLGKKAELITWLEGDITSIDLPTQYYELWHDRAVFHFLTELEQQRKYRDNLLKALKPGGHLIIGTFGIFGGAFELKRHYKELHITPGGVEQMYLYCHFYRTD